MSGMNGFPRDGGILGDLFGVSEADRAEWDKQRQMRLERQQRNQSGLLNKATQAAYNIAAAGITSQMRAAYIEEARGTMVKETITTTRSQSRNIDPEFEAIRRDTGGYEFGG